MVAGVSSSVISSPATKTADSENSDASVRTARFPPLLLAILAILVYYFLVH